MSPSVQSIIVDNCAPSSQDTISRSETASQYQASVRERVFPYHTNLRRARPSSEPNINPAILKFWKQGWEQQNGRAREYNAAVEKVTRLKTEG
ncbi:MAG: hypothetical protein Q9161_000492 [Pseudevernia consocians]